MRRLRTIQHADKRLGPPFTIRALGIARCSKGGRMSARAISLFIALLGCARAGYAQTSAQSIADDGTLPDLSSYESAISGDGSVIVFESDASNLVPNDTNQMSDVFLRNRNTGTIQRVSVSSSGEQADSDSFNPSISADGRYVVFASNGSNLVPDDTNGVSDVFIRDTETGETTRISTNESGEEGNDTSYRPVISGNGRYGFFISSATNLNTTPNRGFVQVYRKDTQTGVVQTVSVGTGGEAADGNIEDDPLSASFDGSSVVFSTRAMNLINGDTNGTADVFVHSVNLGTTSRVSVNSAGAQSVRGGRRGTLSADGRFVAFESVSNNLVALDTNRVSDVFIHDRSTAQTTRVSVGPEGVQGNGMSRTAAISADGRFVVYESLADNLVAGMPQRAAGDDTSNILVFDRLTGTTTLASVASDGTIANDTAVRPAIANDGLVISFESGATNLVPGVVATADVIYANVDQCPEDPEKRVAGVCGCGVADADDDEDGVLLCDDSCPDDPRKSMPGVCGCGESDVDSDGSGAPDCIDPKFDTVPEAPRMKRSGGKLRLNMERFDSNRVVYKWFLYDRRGKKVVQSGVSSRSLVLVAISPKLWRSRLSARNSLRLGGVESRLSPLSRPLSSK